MGLDVCRDTPADQQANFVFLVDLEQVEQCLVNFLISLLAYAGVGKIRTGQQVAEELVGAAYLDRVHRHIRFNIREQGNVIDEIQVDPGGVDLNNFSHVLSLPKDSDFDFLYVEVGALKRQVFDAL
ncbi:hypothetical protein D9M69_534550 [compost metagenome]